MTQRAGRSTDGEGLDETAAGLPRSRARLWRGRATAVVGVGAVAAALAACGTSGTTASATPTSSRPTDVPAPKQWVIKVGDLPQGWHESSPPAADFRMMVCGVDIEPVLAIRAGAWRWSQSGLGPFLAQQVRVYRNDQAESVISALQAALPTCTKTVVPKSKGSTETVTFTIEPITIAGAGPDTVAWRQTTVSAEPVTSEIVLTRRGKTAVMFNSYTVGRKLDRDVLVKAVAALQQTPAS